MKWLVSSKQTTDIWGVAFILALPSLVWNNIVTNILITIAGVLMIVAILSRIRDQAREFTGDQKLLEVNWNDEKNNFSMKRIILATLVSIVVIGVILYLSAFFYFNEHP